MSKITLIGLNNYDPTLFDNLVIPEGIDRETLIDNILLKSDEFEVIYADFDFNKSLIGLLSKKWYRTIEKWYAALQLEYNPIENYDRYEEYTDKGISSGNVSAHDTTQASGNGTTQTDVSAFDSSGYQPKDKVSSNSGSTSKADSSSESTNNTVNEHTGHLHGNIGVTTSQQMLQSELDIALFNLYDRIAMLFVAELVIPIY